MATTPEFAEQVCGQIGRYHPIRSRKMFGGVGIFSEESGNMFALISSDDVVYMKVDNTNRAEYEQMGAAQFHRMPYFELGGLILVEDDEQLRTLVEMSVGVAARAPAKKKKKKKK
ncbi:MAG: TfoX/Sxy family protein [Chloroflexota bacterium]